MGAETCSSAVLLTPAIDIRYTRRPTTSWIGGRCLARILRAAPTRLARQVYEAVLSINHPTAPFVGALERDPNISLIGTLAMLVEAPGDFDMVQQRRIWALADVLASR